MTEKQVHEDNAGDTGNVCIIEYNERELGHMFVNKVYTPDGVDISVRFVKQKVSDGKNTYDPENSPGKIQRHTFKLTLQR